MAEFERLHAGNSEVQEKQAIAFDFAQTATPGLVATGVLTGLMVVQTSTASGSVVIGAGAGVIGSTVGAGASEAINPGDVTYNVLTANPVGGLPRNDIIVWDSTTKLLAVVVGTPNATPSDPTVANTKLPLARLRHAASATTIPLAKIDDIRTFTGLRGTPIPVSSQAQRDALSAYAGLQVKRLDLPGVPVETSDGATWFGSRVTVAAPASFGTGWSIMEWSAICSNGIVVANFTAAKSTAFAAGEVMFGMQSGYWPLRNHGAGAFQAIGGTPGPAALAVNADGTVNVWGTISGNLRVYGVLSFVKA